MIKDIENAVIERLTEGLGNMAASVGSYGGEFDTDGLNQIINRLPACWVVFDGIGDTVPCETRRRRYRVTARFAVLVADRAYGGEPDSRLGGLHEDDVGSYRLVRAVRLLLGGQSFGLAIRPFCPKSVRSLFTRQIEHDALSVMAAEFETEWYETALEDGAWPVFGSGGTLDYGGRGQAADEDFTAADLQVRATPKTPNDPADTEAIIHTEERKS